MRQKKGKIKWYILPAVVVVLIAGLFLLNLHLTKRLEKYLKKELIQRTSDATDGFYNLSFKDLSISLFKGELKMEGIQLAPDSAVFRQWADIDSLPQTYINAQIGEIDFKGINLTWRWSYKKLHFNSFEIKSPDIRVFESYYSSRTEKKTKNIESKTLYEVISPYINVLSVRTLNLVNANASFTVENPATPIYYALTDVSFHAYGFRLDEDSSDSGKLLYCDNFDFVTNRRQSLLTNNDFTLETDSIRLSTEDSIIYIQNITLIPQEELWLKKGQKPDTYLNALIKTVEVQGIRFTREEALNYLTARSFNIDSSDIKVFDQKNSNQQKQQGWQENDSITSAVQSSPLSEADSLVQSLSLYDIISPVLNSVAISYIGIGNTSLQYALTVKDTVEIYKLGNFDFHADKFLVDSISEDNQNLWYSQNFAFEATDIEGIMTARNHRFSVKRMALNTETGNFSIEKVLLRPLSSRTHNDYMSGSISMIGLHGLLYDKGISAELLKIDRPVVRYFKAPPYADTKSVSGKQADSQVDIKGILNPFLRYLSLKKINLNQASITLNDRSTSDPVTYELNNFNFFATDILFNEDTGKGSILFFDYGDMGFSFSNFNNYLPGKMYRLTIREGQFSTLQGLLQLQEIKLMPQEQPSGQTPETAVSISTPLIRVDGLKRFPKNVTRNLKINSFLIDTPEIRVVKADGSQLQASLKHLELKSISWDSVAFKLGSIDIVNPLLDIRTTDRFIQGKQAAKQDTSQHLYNSLKSFAGQITIAKLNLTNANISYEHSVRDSLFLHQKLNTTNLQVEGLSIDNAKHKFSLDNIQFNTKEIEFPLDNGFYTLKAGSVDLDKTSFSVNNLHLVSTYPKMEFAYKQPKHKDWFDVRVGNVTLSQIDLPAYFSDKVLRIGDVQVNDAVLQNFKNQQIIVPRRIVPMIYSGLQKAPIKIDFKNVEVNNFSVIYEELARKGTQPGKLYFTEMNGKFSGFTNIVSSPTQYIRLDANGKLMGAGSFTATWQLPVDSLNDLFLLNARIDSFNLTKLNELIKPLASAEVQSGRLQSMTFSTEATSKEANVEMLFLYNDLKATLLKEKNGNVTDNEVLSRLANLVIKRDNPDKKRGKTDQSPRHSHVFIQRDPYHSTFNYLWQILRPPLTESVGISKKKQDTAKGVMTFITKVKNFFGHKKKSAPAEAPDSADKDP